MTSQKAPPMRNDFYFIRHGESESNAGLKTDNPNTVSLTPHGWGEARHKARLFHERPDRIITSKYRRTQQTAEPFIEKFAGVPVEEWNIHEFTYLPVTRYKNTTNLERQPHIRKFWTAADPQYKEDDTAESFAEFANRCRETVAQMRDNPSGLTLAFSHGYLIKGVLFLLNGHMEKINAETMRKFWQYHAGYVVENCAELRFTINPDKSITFKGHERYIGPQLSEVLMID